MKEITDEVIRKDIENFQTRLSAAQDVLADLSGSCFSYAEKKKKVKNSVKPRRRSATCEI